MADNSNIRLICPNLKCRAVLSVPAAARGRNIRCGKCGTTVRVPGGQPAPSTAKPA